MKKVEPVDYTKPSLFMSWAEGENIIRVLDGIYEYKKWGTKAAGRYISQIVFDVEAKVDPIFTRKDKKGNVPKPKRCWGFIIYSHQAKEFRIVEAGVRLGHPLAELIKSDEGFKEKDIIVTKKSGKYSIDNEYTVRWGEPTEEAINRTPTSIAEYKYCQKYFEPNNGKETTNT